MPREVISSHQAASSASQSMIFAFSAEKSKILRRFAKSCFSRSAQPHAFSCGQRESSPQRFQLSPPADLMGDAYKSSGTVGMHDLETPQDELGAHLTMLERGRIVVIARVP
jgi:hypothetical protein